MMKKPPDKEVCISLKFLNEKELNKLIKQVKIKKLIKRKLLRSINKKSGYNNQLSICEEKFDQIGRNDVIIVVTVNSNIDIKNSISEFRSYNSIN
jgi:hypothetical protein